jgi:hypothetical protein
MILVRFVFVKVLRDDWPLVMSGEDSSAGEEGSRERWCVRKEGSSVAECVR